MAWACDAGNAAAFAPWGGPDTVDIMGADIYRWVLSICVPSVLEGNSRDMGVPKSVMGLNSCANLNLVYGAQHFLLHVIIHDFLSE